MAAASAAGEKSCGAYDVPVIVHVNLAAAGGINGGGSKQHGARMALGMK